MNKIEPIRIIGGFRSKSKLRVYHIEGMQESIDPEGTARIRWFEDEERRTSFIIYEERRRKCKQVIDEAYGKRLPEDSEEQLRYDAIMDSIVNYKNYDEYKYKTSLKYKVLKFFKLTK